MSKDDVMNLAEQAWDYIQGEDNNFQALERNLYLIVGQFAWLLFNEVRNEREKEEI